MEEEADRYSYNPGPNEGNSLVFMLWDPVDVGGMPGDLWGVIKVRVKSFDVRERVVTNDVLVEPHIGRAEHKACLHSKFVHSPVIGEGEVTGIMENIDAEDPHT